MIGKRLGHYEITGQLGQGGMGEVYRATDTRLDRQVALKTLPPNVARSAERRARFEREAKAVAALNHPNIVTIHSVEQHEGVSFITMELVDGQSLDALIRQGALSLGQVFDIAVPLADALAAAHRKGVTHRDLKPANVMLNEENRVKVLDFGLAKLAGPPAPGEEDSNMPTATAMVTGEGKILGTAAYMSPEQAEGKPVDARTDVFSLGIVLYEMTTGKRPFQGDTTISTITSILRDEPPPVRELKPELPRHLGRIIQRCLAKRPDRRYQSALDVRNELEALQGEIDTGELQSPASGFRPAPPASPGGHPSSSGPVSGAPSSTGVSTSGASATIPPVSQVTSAPPLTDASVTISVPPQAPRSRGLLVALLVVVALLLGAATMLLVPRFRPGSSGGAAVAIDDKSIAVLPFANMSDAKENEFFSDGLAEELLNVLSKVPDLRVAARTSSFQFKGHTGDVSRVAQQLNVATILEGSVRRAGDRVRVTAQLVNAADGFPMWSETYERQLDDVFGIQEEIATQVVDALKITLLGEDAQRLSARPTDNIEAYDAYLLGHQKMRSRHTDLLKEAAEKFQRAIDLDPGFALAHVGLAECNMLLFQNGALGREEALQRAEPLVEKAMALESQLGEAYAMRGYVKGAKFDFAGATADYERAIELNPNHAQALVWYGRHMGFRDLERSSELLHQALELDPLSPLVLGNIAGNERARGNYEAALKRFKRVLEIDPQFPAYNAVADIYEDHLGRPDEALRWAERSVEADPRNLENRISLAGRLENRGEYDRSLAILRETIELDPGHARTYGAMGNLHNNRGRLDEAMRWYQEQVQREPQDSGGLFALAYHFLRLSDEITALKWLTRLKDAEETPFLSRFVEARILFRDDPDKAQEIVRELAEQLPRIGAPWIFGGDMDAKRYDAIVEREGEVQPDLLDEDPRVDHQTLGGAMRMGAALIRRGDPERGELLLEKAEAFLLDMDEKSRRARYSNSLAWVYYHQGRVDESLTEFRLAYDSGWRPDFWMPLKHSTWWESLYEQPRFQAIVDDTAADYDRQRRALAREGLAEAEPSF